MKPRMLFTGASGFLGRNIIPTLRKEYDIDTLSRSEGSDIKCNISRHVPELRGRYDIVVHAAAKVRGGAAGEYYEINYRGTLNLTHALENCGVPKSIVFISSVAVYGLDEGTGIDENTPLGATDPYGLSKVIAENQLTEWCKNNNVTLTILRPALLVGFNPKGSLRTIAKGIRKGYYAGIGDGSAMKSMTMASDIAKAIPLVEAKGGVYNICSPMSPTFLETERMIADALGVAPPRHIPMWLGRLLLCRSPKLSKMTRTLTFSADKIVKETGIKLSPVNFGALRTEA